MSDDRNAMSSALIWIGMGFLFVFAMQQSWFRWLLLLALLAGGSVRAKHKMDEEVMPLDASGLVWTLDATNTADASAAAPQFSLSLTVRNSGDVYLSYARTRATLYECPYAGAGLTECARVDDWTGDLTLDLPGGYVHHPRLPVRFSHGPAAHPQVTLTVDDVVALPKGP